MALHERRQNKFLHGRADRLTDAARSAALS
jgi:hypothetical protein